MGVKEKQEEIEMLKAKSAYYEAWIKTISEACATVVDADYAASLVVNKLGFGVSYFDDRTISLFRTNQTSTTKPAQNPRRTA